MAIVQHNIVPMQVCACGCGAPVRYSPHTGRPYTYAGEPGTRQYSACSSRASRRKQREIHAVSREKRENEMIDKLLAENRRLFEMLIERFHAPLSASRNAPSLDDLPPLEIEVTEAAPDPEAGKRARDNFIRSMLALQEKPKPAKNPKQLAGAAVTFDAPDFDDLELEL